MLVGGHGFDLETDDGHTVLDAASGVGVTALGYDCPRIVEAMTSQARKLQYVHSLRFQTPVQRELADRIVRHTPSPLNSCCFVSGGSEATETAIKFCRQYWVECGRPQKWRVAGRWPSFHGSTIASLSASWHRARRAGHLPLLLDFPHVEAPNSYRGCGHCVGENGCTLQCARELERLLIREDPETIAAFIVEPIVGAAAGAFVPPHEYLAIVREICDRYEILMIADEVITGFGRTGRWFAIDHWQVEPDMILFAKGISAGFAPLGGVVVRDRYVEVMRQGSGRFEHNFTMTGHPVACAAGCAALDELERCDVPTRVSELEGELFDALAGVRERRTVGDVRGKGFLVGIELVADRTTKAPFPSDARAASRIAELAFDQGLLVYPCTGGADGYGDHLLLMPALTMPRERFGDIGRRLEQAIDRFEQERV